MDKIAYLLVNFGGPRDLNEVEEFLTALLTDQEVIRTPFPAFLHRILFTRVAKKRAVKILPDYEKIGGRSPIFADTEALAKSIGEQLGTEVATFHRYLPKTHPLFIEKMRQFEEVSEIRVFPLFPQFSYATTGSIALWFARHLPKSIVNKLSWVKSYASDPSFIDPFEACIREFLTQKELKEEETALLFSAHGLPKKFIATGDIYESQCNESYNLLKERFPKALSILCYQSQFGKQEWIRPSTADVCKEIGGNGRKNAVVIPLSFTSDHIETLFEIEEQYLPLIRNSGLQAYRCPALNLRNDWIEGMAKMFKEAKSQSNPLLLRTQ